MPSRATGGKRARQAAHRIIDRFGYLQLDTVSIAGARSHALVLLSRLDGLDPEVGETLLRQGEPIFEYWGHEACWLPLDLYPAFEFRRLHYAQSSRFREILEEHRDVATLLRRKILEDGPVRSADLEGEGAGGGWWGHKPAKRVAIALWFAGELAIRERRGFQRTFDLAERVIPEPWRARPLTLEQALPALLLRALDGHGWATTGTVSDTWRLLNLRPQILNALHALREAGSIVPCALVDSDGKRKPGWIRPEHLQLAARLSSVRPSDPGRLLSPFDPVLWDRRRVAQLFGFTQILEIFKPESQRVYGYFCLPVLAGEELIGRVDLRTDRRLGALRVLAQHLESSGVSRSVVLKRRRALRTAVERHARLLDLRPQWR